MNSIPLTPFVTKKKQCVPIPGLGFRRGSYKCVCRRGFYFPEVQNEMKYFNGSILEEEYAKLMQVSDF